MLKRILLDVIGLTRAYLKKARHARSRNKKGNILEHLGQFQDENPLSSI